MAKNNRTNKVATAPKQGKNEVKVKERKPFFLPTMAVMFVAVWLWAWLWYGNVFRIAREYSFWSADPTLMQHIEGRPWAQLLWIGQALLMTFRWPILGAAIMALMITLGTYLVGYCLRLRGWWRMLQYVPAVLFMSTIAYNGFDIYFETETGLTMGIPLICVAVLTLMALIIRSFSHSHKLPSMIHPPKDETPWQNRAQMLAIAATVFVPVAITQWMRPYVRVVTKMQCQMMEQDWRGMAETAREKPELSYRQIAAYYAIALVQTGEQASHLFDIRLDYDEPYMHGYSGSTTNNANYYLMDCDMQAGLVQTAIHHGMEQMTMNGPSIRTIKVLTKCALLKGEWEVARKYLCILEHVPFESEFTKKYRPMLRHPELVEADHEFHMIRQTEPIHDSFENFYIQPTFLGYNATLLEGRSQNALWNSLMVHIYTKTMPQFIERCQALQGQTLPKSVAEALILMSGKRPELLQAFPSIQYHRDRLATFLQDTKTKIKDYDTRKEHAEELFPKWKGYYPYYYFFGNLKNTRGHIKENEGTSNQGVN